MPTEQQEFPIPPVAKPVEPPEKSLSPLFAALSQCRTNSAKNRSEKIVNLVNYQCINHGFIPYPNSIEDVTAMDTWRLATCINGSPELQEILGVDPLKMSNAVSLILSATEMLTAAICAEHQQTNTVLMSMFATAHMKPSAFDISKPFYDDEQIMVDPHHVDYDPFEDAQDEDGGEER